MELLDKSLVDPLYSIYSTSTYPRYETYRIKDENIITNGLITAAITALLVGAFGINKVTTQAVKETITTFAASTAAIIFVQGYRMTYYTNRSYIFIYKIDPMFKYWDSVYTNQSRTNLVDETFYDSGVNW